MLRTFRKTRLVVFVLLLCLLSSSATLAAVRADSSGVKSAYLSHYFGIDISRPITAGEYAEYLLKLQPQGSTLSIEPADAPRPLAMPDAIKYAVIGANMEELALVYTDEKIAASLSKAGVSGVPAGYSAYVACALDLGMLDAETVTAGAEADANSIISLLMAVADMNGVSRNYAGYTDDPGIIAEVINRWKSFTLFDDEKLSAIGADVVTRKLTTGFSLKSGKHDARFLPELTLIYGHDDIKHAAQILSLLKSEGVSAKVQVEPKVSIYQYMPEWGEPSAPTPTYEVRKVRDGLMLVYATEYDLVLEFENPEDMKAINGLIMAYAKKNSGEEGKRLLHGSWWQPLYYARSEMGEGYRKIYDNAAENGDYSLHSLSMAAGGAKLLMALSEEPGLKVSQSPVWADLPFYRYLNGESE
ncbi:MAG: hypothetical protein LBU26_01195 [Synergistaceae bacterium]|jgi:hypothetical protein|nr:hypothetical protein [Synergistaceae bacterium]